MLTFPRRAGALLHPTSLPGRFGIGDLGDAASAFVDFLARAGQTYWQILPLSPTGYGDSPYLCFSAFAGNPLLISPDRLAQAGHLSAEDLRDVPAFPNDRVDFGAVIRYKTALLDRACASFRANASNNQRAAFRDFCRAHAHWLDDYALFSALKAAHNGQPWYEWERDLATREPRKIAKECERYAKEIESEQYRQWLFFEQWRELKQHANARGIRVIGDVPIFVARDSADVWANPHLFHLDANWQPTVVSGVPPDFFSTTGQLWGHPLYRWDVMERDGFAWWIARFRMALTQADVIRIDHFRGFYNYWEVPADATTAINGQWRFGPGAKLFRAVNAALGAVAIIAEDLGDFNAASRAGVDALRAEFGIPGMKVLRFAFDNDPAHPFLPHHYTRDWIVYTTSHDSETAVGWWQESATETERDFARRYLSVDGSNIAWDLIRAAWGSVAHTAIAPAQDLLQLGNSARMNFPSTVGPPNWCWRVLPGALNDDIAARLREVTAMCGRAG